MATVFKRILVFCRNQKTFLLPQRERIEIGKKVAEAYRQQNGEMPQKWLKNKEPEGVFNVIKYPTEFIPVIDKIISEYKPADTHIIKGPVMTKRKRIPVKAQKEFSVKL